MKNHLLLSSAESAIRTNVRNFLVAATEAELQRELEISNQRGDLKRATFIREMINECGWIASLTY